MLSLSYHTFTQRKNGVLNRIQPANHHNQHLPRAIKKDVSPLWGVAMFAKMSCILICHVCWFNLQPAPGFYLPCLLQVNPLLLPIWAKKKTSFSGRNHPPLEVSAVKPSPSAVAWVGHPRYPGHPRYSKMPNERIWSLLFLVGKGCRKVEHLEIRSTYMLFFDTFWGLLWLIFCRTSHFLRNCMSTRTLIVDF